MPRPSDPTTRQAPPPLAVAASLVAVEGILLVLLGVLELGSLSSSRYSLGLASAVFFLVLGVALGACAWAVSRGRSWARSPIVLAQLIQLGLAWSLRGDPTTAAAVALGAVAIVVLVGLLHPASIRALADER